MKAELRLRLRRCRRGRFTFVVLIAAAIFGLFIFGAVCVIRLLATGGHFGLKFSVVVIGLDQGREQEGFTLVGQHAQVN